MDRHADNAANDALARGEAGAALAVWLAGHVAGYRGPARGEKFAGGQSNSTFKLIAPSGAYMLRRKPPGETPRVHALCADAAQLLGEGG
jgi:aminoglycoside phosphotransferase (APT) family kinase protein